MAGRLGPRWWPRGRRTTDQQSHWLIGHPLPALVGTRSAQTQSTVAQAAQQLTGRHRQGTELDSASTGGFVHVVVVALEANSTETKAHRELMQLLVVPVTHQMCPQPAAPRPARRIDQDHLTLRSRCALQPHVREALSLPCRVRTPYALGVGLDDEDVVLTLPASPEFGDVARLTVGELARRRGFRATDWEDLETAVVHTLHLLERDDTERVRFTFGFRSEEIVVQAELTSPAGRRAIAAAADDRFRARVAGLVDEVGVDHERGRVRFRKARA